ncbi:glycosyltransferase family 4 protein [Serratia entomophila]|uniref:glycosyltransferase family 4 protein n=1 Tax=Serratia entomophila TaxID=42906 RepID=UPI00217A95AE|nr:glycosyltransferase family 4 protein [Serratia entomophila]CAI1121662.1 sugar transferase, PEP-CTERM/EpsH1 system associated [Serratia entomophila]CAI1832933.1 sugar transferase, PEP-CTERM/EpsH1 system associated [Serratia entomophila]CAI1853961.1 sugar transferase, PEP-CTERM/EpsH1 system associated [Serratia entomophila]CAI1902092.1 sugar transferase, PEP-CTERM/EpsH1 system associated [Serratia entomophila]CAI1934319.1 sugar transferase, PEP-CTERM/EpsH1 system associated [Serratia entomoph
MKVLVVNTLYAPYRIGGAEISVQILCEGLVSQGHQVRVLTLHSESYRKCSVINGVEVVYLPLKNIYWPFDNRKRSGLSRGLWHLIDSYNVASRIQFGKELDIYEPDLVHTNNLAGFSVSVWSAAKKRGVKIVHTARDYYLFHPNSTLYTDGGNQNPHSYGVLIWSFLRRLQSRKVSSFIGISEFIKNFHIDSGFFPQSQASFIYNAVAVSPTKTRENAHLSIGFIGRLSVAKGFDTFCRLIQTIRGKSRDIAAVAAGDYAGDETASLARLATEAEVEVLGRTDLLNFLNRVDVVILPTKWREPFGRTVIECALANKVVLAYAVGGITELMKIVPTVSELKSDLTYDRLKEIMSEKQAVTAQVSGLFSSETITQEYIEEYDRVKNGF